jgi:hypothetical protein
MKLLRVTCAQVYHRIAEDDSLTTLWAGLGLVEIAAAALVILGGKFFGLDRWTLMTQIQRTDC